MTHNTVTPADILERAAEMIDGGWCQGAYDRVLAGRWCRCALGAISSAACIDWCALEGHPAVEALAADREVRALAKQASPALTSARHIVAAWNDAQPPILGGGTVAATMRACAARLRGEGVEP